jgi:hypothetical protein
MPVSLNPLGCAFHWLGGEPAAVHAPVLSPLHQLRALKDAQVF